MSDQTPTVPALNLDDLVDHDAPKVSHNGTQYAMRMPNRIGVQQTARLTRLGQAFLTIGTKLEGVKDEKGDLRPLTEEEEKGVLAEMNKSVDEFMAIVLPSMPTEEREGLDDDKKMALLDFFMQQGAKFRASRLEMLASTSPGSASGTA